MGNICCTHDDHHGLGKTADFSCTNPYNGVLVRQHGGCSLRRFVQDELVSKGIESLGLIGYDEMALSQYMSPAWDTFELLAYVKLLYVII